MSATTPLPQGELIGHPPTTTRWLATSSTRGSFFHTLTPNIHSITPDNSSTRYPPRHAWSLTRFVSHGLIYMYGSQLPQTSPVSVTPPPTLKYLRNNSKWDFWQHAAHISINAPSRVISETWHILFPSWGMMTPDWNTWGGLDFGLVTRSTPNTVQILPPLVYSPSLFPYFTGSGAAFTMTMPRSNKFQIFTSFYSSSSVVQGNMSRWYPIHNHNPSIFGMFNFLLVPNIFAPPLHPFPSLNVPPLWNSHSTIRRAPHGEITLGMAYLGTPTPAAYKESSIKYVIFAPTCPNLPYPYATYILLYDGTL